MSKGPNTNVERLNVIVLGGSSGIGASTCKKFYREGHAVAIADLQEEKGRVLAQSLGSNAVFIKTDVTDEASIAQMIQQAVSAFGRIDIAVNTAGVTGPTQEGHLITEKDWNFVMKIDSEGAWKFSKAIITYWRQQEPRVLRNDPAPFTKVTQRGSLVNVASSLGSLGQPYLAAYCAAKHAVIGMSKALALENAQHGIRINTISPGLCLTPMMMTPEFDFEMAKKVYLQNQPVGRFGHPDEIAAAIYFTASDKASFMTGVDFNPDGGYQIA